jgi:hypothetical protein
MGHEKHWQQMLQYQPEAWRTETGEQGSGVRGQGSGVGGQGWQVKRSQSNPDVREQSKVLELLGRVNYKIIKGNRVYVEVDGVVYKTLYGGYWRSVFTGIEHYLLRCEQVSGFVWAEESCASEAVDLPIAYSNDGWTAGGYSLSFMLSRE